MAMGGQSRVRVGASLANFAGKVSEALSVDYCQNICPAHRYMCIECGQLSKLSKKKNKSRQGSTGMLNENFCHCPNTPADPWIDELALIALIFGAGERPLGKTAIDVVSAIDCFRIHKLCHASMNVLSFVLTGRIRSQIAELSHGAGGELKWEKTPLSQEPPNAMSNLAKQFAVTQILEPQLREIRPEILAAAAIVVAMQTLARTNFDEVVNAGKPYAFPSNLHSSPLSLPRFTCRGHA
jgi:hypothetical protein